jgi:hypothetical protein
MRSARSQSHAAGERGWDSAGDARHNSILFRCYPKSRINRHPRRSVENSSGHSVKRPYEPPSTKAIRPRALLSNVNGGQTVSINRIGQIVFSPGPAGDAVFYMQRGKMKLSVAYGQSKEVVAILDAGDFCGGGVWRVKPLACQRPWR